MIPCSILTLLTDLSEEGQEEEEEDEDVTWDDVLAEDEAEADTEDAEDAEDADDGELGDSGGGGEGGEETVGRFRLGSAPTTSSEPGTHSHFLSICNKSGKIRNICNKITANAAIFTPN